MERGRLTQAPGGSAQVTQPPVIGHRPRVGDATQRTDNPNSGQPYQPGLVTSTGWSGVMGANTCKQSLALGSSDTPAPTVRNPPEMENW